jgi:hypothetical protein
LQKTSKSQWLNFFLNNQIETHFHPPLSVQVFQEYQERHQLIQRIQLWPGNKDNCQYIWGSDKYTSSKFYHLAYRNLNPPRQFIWTCDSKCTNKIRIFTWLLFMDILHVKNILRKKAKLEGKNYNCVLGAQNREETTFHLFFSCNFNREC